MLRWRSLASAAVVVLVCALWLTGQFAPIQAFVEDHRFPALSRAPTGRIVLVDIDEPSIKAVGVWPWSRSIHAAIVDRLVALQAADIAFDIDFSSESTAEGDAAFEGSLKRAGGGVVLAALQQRSGSASAAHGVIQSRPLSRFADNAWEGSVDVWPDPDGRLRSFARAEPFGGSQLPSLAALLGSGSTITQDPFRVDYGIDAARLVHVSVADLLGGKVGAAAIGGRKVIVGASAVELRDYFQVPRFGLVAGSEVQALAAESLLQGRALQHVGPLAALIVTIVVLGLVGIGGRRLPYLGFLGLCLVSAAAVEAGAVLVQALWPVVPVTAPTHAGLVALALVAVSAEIGERRLKLQTAKRETNRLRDILDRVIADNFAGIVVVDRHGQVRAISAAAVALLGPEARVAERRHFDQVLPAELANLMDEAMTHARAGTSNPHAVHELRCSLQERVVTLECVSTVSDDLDDLAPRRKSEKDFAICLTFQDVTEKRQAEARLAELARVDGLSGLANRYVYLDGIEEIRASGRPAALIFFDVDRFKLINDRFGHAAGDALIHAMADRVRAVIAPGDIAARLGGDEFGLLVERRSQAEAYAFAESLVRHLGGLYDVAGVQIWVAISVGFAVVDGPDTKQSMACADAALYAAKTAGGNRARVYDAAMKGMIEDGQRLEQDLRDAMRRGEFEVVYQRQVDTEHERIVGVEALARWRHPDRGYISPSVFIPIAERTGLIEPLGTWVLETACEDAASWPVPIKVSVNVSAVQLAHARLADTILGALAQSGLAASRLDLELTESLLMENNGLTRGTLERLRAAGVTVSLDDFGTGYSSLSYLKSFAIDKVKIDQSFVRDLPRASSSTAIIRAVIGLAGDLGLRVNAEGVETVEQLRILRRLGCDEVQGFLYGKPEPAPMIAGSLARQLTQPLLAYRAAS